MTIMNGIFKFYQNGELICESKNNLTQNGRAIILKTLLGALPTFGSSIGVGTGATANTLSSTSYVPTQVVVTGTTAVTATFSYHSFLPGDSITISGVSASGLTGINGVQTVTSITTTTISFTDSGLTAGTYSTSGTLGTFSKSTGLATNKALDFEVSRFKVLSSSLGSEDTYDALVFKGQLEDESAMIIKEVGLFSELMVSSLSGVSSKTLTSFEQGDTLVDTDGDAFDIAGTDNARLVTVAESPSQAIRIGNYGLRLYQTTAEKFASLNQKFVNLNIYQNTDYVKLAAYASSTGSTVTVKFYTDSSYISYAFTLSSGYATYQLAKSAGTLSGTVDWNNITKITFEHTNATLSTYVILDGLKMEPISRIDSNNGLVSRTVLATPITKIQGVPIDIEYYVRANFNA